MIGRIGRGNVRIRQESRGLCPSTPQAESLKTGVLDLGFAVAFGEVLSSTAHRAVAPTVWWNCVGCWEG